VNDVTYNLSYPFGTLPYHQRSFLNPRFQHIIHVLRNPLDQISSFTVHTNKSYAFVMKIMNKTLDQYHRHLHSALLSASIDSSTPWYIPISSSASGTTATNRPLSSPQSILQQLQIGHAQQSKCYRGQACHLQFAVLTWIYWNLFVAATSDKTYQIEQSGHLLDELCSILWPKYDQTKQYRRCMDERRLMLTSTTWRWWLQQQRKQYFPSYSSHRQHHHYTLDEIQSLVSPAIYQILLDTAKKFGYQVLSSKSFRAR
jgi:hypothetical protein